MSETTTEPGNQRVRINVEDEIEDLTAVLPACRQESKPEEPEEFEPEMNCWWEEPFGDSEAWAHED